MSRNGNCWDNAMAESFFSSLKKERIRKRIYKTRDLARADIFDYIEVYYNRALRYQSGGLRTGLVVRAEFVYCRGGSPIERGTPPSDEPIASKPRLIISFSLSI